MPIYEYVCDSCHNELEVIQKISEPQLTDCPQCNQATLKRKASISAFHLKGGGWYKDGYSVPDGNNNGKSDKAEADTTKPASDSKAADSKVTDAKPASKTEKSSTKSTDPKPAKKETVPSSKAS